MKVAASTLAYLNHPLTLALKRICGFGFEGVEIYFEGMHSLPGKELLDNLSIYDFELFLHAPFSDLNLASFNQTVLEESKKQVKRSLEIGAEIEAQLATVHFGRYSPLGLSYPETAVERNLKSVREIASFSESLGIKVAFENAPEGFGAMLGPLDLIEKLTTEEDIKITLDVGHANTWGISVEEFISRLNSSIAHAHLHDNTGDSDLHMALGEGGIDYKKVLKAFRKIKYKNALCLEMLCEEDLKRSRNMIRTLLSEGT